MTTHVVLFSVFQTMIVWCQNTNFHDFTNHRGNQPWLELLWSRDIHATYLHVTKILQNF